jgi:elongation factor Ts
LDEDVEDVIMEIAATAVKELREKTGAGLMDCKKALAETQGDFEKAVVWLREKGVAQAAKRSGRAANQGVIGSYVHSGKVGVLVEVNCETDFVGKTDDFQALAKELAMQVAASAPRYVTREEIPAPEIDQERSIYLAEAKQSGKPEAVQQKIAEGKVESYYKQVCLMDQPYIREPKKSVKQYVTEVAAKLGENVVVRRFTRLQLGE